MKVGMTQRDVEDLLERRTETGIRRRRHVQVGEFSAFPHGSVKPQGIREARSCLIDGGCSVEGYASDITRTFVLGKAPDKTKTK